jgi:hypothetical protein
VVRGLAAAAVTAVAGTAVLLVAGLYQLSVWFAESIESGFEELS